MNIYQIIDALDYGDAVSNHCLEIKKILDLSNIENSIHSKYYHEKVAIYRESIEELIVSKQDIIIFHFSGKSNLVNYIKKMKCKKVLIYHNITPEIYFENMEPHYTHCLEGRSQLSSLVGIFNYYVGDSLYNVNELEKLGCSPCGVLPITVELDIKKTMRTRFKVKPKETKIIFVGRVAPNKMHEDIIKTFEYFHTYIDPQSKLFLIGNFEAYEVYYDRLLNLCKDLLSKEQIIFTGKISAEELDFHYKTADVFLSMSEHEGFCVPILESMSYGIPTFAYKAGAIETTMGHAGVKLLTKKHDDIAELINYILEDQVLISSIVENQYNWLDNFSVEKTSSCLLDLIEQVRKDG